MMNALLESHAKLIDSQRILIAEQEKLIEALRQDSADWRILALRAVAVAAPTTTPSTTTPS